MTIRLKIAFVILTLFIGLMVKSQPTGMVLTKKQNEVWFDSARSLTNEKEIEFIKTRILQDTIVYNTNQIRSDRVNIENSKKEQSLKEYGFIAEGRILYFVKIKDQTIFKDEFINFQWDNWTQNSKILRFYNFLSTDKIKAIEFITDNDIEKTVYGEKAGFGIIIFNLNNRKHLKEFKKIRNE